MRQQPSTFFGERNCRILFEIVCGVVLFLAPFNAMGMSAPVHAATDGAPSMGLQPVFYDPHNLVTRSYFIFNSTAGAHFKSEVRVTNTGTTAGHASLYSTDATTGATSGAIYEGRNSKPRDVGAWINLTTTSVTLAPGQSQAIPFTVTLPNNIRSGEHLGGIAMEVTPVTPATPSAQQKGKVQINTRIVTVVAVEVILPGTPIQALSATGIQAGGMNNYQTMSLNLHNTGTMMIKPSGTLELFDVHGAHLQTVPLKMDTFLPATSIDYPVYLKQSLGTGRYQAVLTLNYGDTHTVQPLKDGGNHILRYSTFFTITMRQVQQAFPSSSGTLQAPHAAIVNSSLPWWVFLVGGFFVLCGLLFLLQQSRRFVLGARRRRKGAEG